MEVSFDPTDPTESPPSGAYDSRYSPRDDKLRRLLLRNKQEYENHQKKTIEMGTSGSDVQNGSRVWAMPRRPTGTRQAVGSHEDVQFTTSIRKSPKRPPAKPGYKTEEEDRPQSAFNDGHLEEKKSIFDFFKIDSLFNFNFKINFFHGFNKDKLLNFLVIAAWGFCFFLLLRLIFTERGVIDFHSRMNVLSNKKMECSLIKEDNAALKREINLIKTDRSYQKKLVRDHLGFIGTDEYLILFAKVKKKNET